MGHSSKNLLFNPNCCPQFYWPVCVVPVSTRWLLLPTNVLEVTFKLPLILPNCGNVAFIVFLLIAIFTKLKSVFKCRVRGVLHHSKSKVFSWLSIVTQSESQYFPVICLILFTKLHLKGSTKMFNFKNRFLKRELHVISLWITSNEAFKIFGRYPQILPISTLSHSLYMSQENCNFTGNFCHFSSFIFVWYSANILKKIYVWEELEIFLFYIEKQ